MQTKKNKKHKAVGGSPASRAVVGGGSKSIEPMPGRGYTLKMNTVKHPVQHAKPVWNRVDAHQTNIAHARHDTMRTIDRGIVYPNTPNKTNNMVFGGKPKASGKKKPKP